MSERKTWHFAAADSMFFGSGKPMNAGESAWIDSHFPPNGLTLQGAVRTAVLYYTGADIDAFVNGRPCFSDGRGLQAEIGDANSLGRLELTGPFLSCNGETLFPAPLDLMRNAQRQYALLKPAEQAVSCDLGAIRLPTLKENGYKTVENYYIKHSDMIKLLADNSNGIEPIPLFTDDPNGESLADKEPKIGLARNNHTRNSVESMLFAIAPVRPRKGVNLSLRVQGIAPEHVPRQAFLQKLGGEGKLAGIRISDADIIMPDAQITVQGNKLRFKLVFTQPALMPVDGWLPDSFTPTAAKDGWHGEMNGCPVFLVSACVGKAVKLGGWDLKNHCSKIHQAYIPAGSVYFFEARANDLERLKTLHDSKLGGNREYGFGHVLLGHW